MTRIAIVLALSVLACGKSDEEKLTEQTEKTRAAEQAATEHADQIRKEVAAIFKRVDALLAAKEKAFQEKLSAATEQVRAEAEKRLAETEQKLGAARAKLKEITKREMGDYPTPQRGANKGCPPSDPLCGI